MKKILFILSVVLCSCSSIKIFYQVYNVESDGLIEKNGYLFYSNEDCDISYNFWERGGNAGFTIHNKTEHDLFFDLSKTFFVKNGVAYDYFKNREYIHFGANSISSFYSPVRSEDNDISISSARGLTVSYKEKPVICVPAKASKSIAEYNIMSGLIKECNYENDYPQTKSVPFNYTIDNTPIMFSNRIAYSYDPECKSLKYIENAFWVSEIVNYSADEAKEKKYIQSCEDPGKTQIDVFKINSPSKFYNQYEEKSSSKFRPRGSERSSDDLYY